MSALAVYLERAGIATTLVALVRLHAEKIRPPRALWVPFEFGRPLGPPRDPAFQTRALRAALDLLEADGGPLLVDFPDDEPGTAGDPRWQPPAPASTPRLVDEVAALEPAYRRWCKRAGRSAVGLTGLTPRACAGLLDQAIAAGAEAPAAVVHPTLSANALLRFACDDLKAFYNEAGCGAQHGDVRPSSGQLGDWFWQATLAGSRLRTLREQCLASADPKRQLLGGGVVPRARL